MNNSENISIEGRRVTENIYLCPDGKYRWIYELNMIKNPIILFTIWKIFLILILILFAFSFLLDLFEGNVRGWFEDFLLTPGVLIIPGIMFGLSIIGYLIVAGMYGWKYMVLFEMDEEGVVHHQMSKQFAKSEAMSWLAVMAGALTNSYSAMGAGILASTKSASASSFSAVKKVIKRKWFHTIKVNELLEKNQVYASDADFDFVWNYIVQRCTNAKIIG